MLSYLGLAVVFSTSLIACYTLARLAPRMQMIAVPGEHRQHEHPTPVVGGIAIYIAIVVGFLLIDASFRNLLPCLLIVCIMGVVDDRYALSSWIRLILQAISAYLMIYLTGVKLESLGFLTFSNQEVLLGSWSVPLTIFATVGVINAVNMSDGMDGLAGSLVALILIALICIGVPALGLAYITLAAVCGFLVFNVRAARDKARLFLGDAGSMMLGLLLAYLLIQFSQTSTGIWPITALWLLALPLIDAVGVLLVRPLRGRSPFAADNAHFHHKLLDFGFGVNSALVIALAVQFLFIFVGIMAWRIGVAEPLQLIAFLCIFALYSLRLWWWMGREKS